MKWSDQEVETAIKQYRDGLSATRVAENLSNMTGRPITRNAVLGHMYRHRILRARPKLGPNAKSKARHYLAGKRSNTGPNLARVKRVQLHQTHTAEPPPENGAVSFADLEHHHCRWPYGSSESTSCSAASLARKGPATARPITRSRREVTDV
jgi:hypothetical protein